MINGLALQDIVAAPLSADDCDVHLYPTAAFIPMCTEFVRWQNCLAIMSLRSALYNSPASLNVHAEALQNLQRERQRRSHGRRESWPMLLTRLARSNAAAAGHGSDIPARSHGRHHRRSDHSHAHRSSHRRSSSSISSSISRTNMERSDGQLSQSTFTGSRPRVLHVHALASMSSHLSSSLSLCAAPSLGQHSSVQLDRTTGSTETLALSQSSISSQDNEQAEVGSRAFSSIHNDTPAVQSPHSDVSVQTGQSCTLQPCAVSVSDSCRDFATELHASDAPRHRLSRCTCAADLEAEGSKSQFFSSPAHQWLRSMSLGSDTIMAGAMREAGRGMRRVSTSDMAANASSMTAEAKKRSGEWLQGQKDSWSIPASSAYNAGNVLACILIGNADKGVLNRV